MAIEMVMAMGNDGYELTPEDEAVAILVIPM